MTVLYKYLPGEFLDDFLSGRSVKIGTLHEYRNIELHGEEIGDCEEGVRDIVDNIDFATGHIPHTITPLIDKVFPSFRNSGAIMSNCVFREKENSSDRYMFCCSNNFDVSAMRRMGKNCCVRINNAEEFFRLITQKLYWKGLITGRMSADKCLYGERVLDSERAKVIPPWAHKPKNLEYQDEYRIVWEPARRPIKQVYIRCIAIRELLTLHHDDHK